jgi:nitroreductase
MQLLQLMQRRCSVRQFTDQPVEREKLTYVLEAARIAPSACNFQPWQFLVVQNKQLMAELAPEWVPAANTPALIVVCGDHTTAWRRADGKDHCDIDIAIAVDHMTLAATEQGLGTCWICSFDAFQVARKLELPPGVEPIVMLPIGYPAESKSADRHAQERKPLTDLTKWL